MPDNFNLHQNYPNPFNPYTTINFDIPEEANTVLKIFDTSGKEIAELINSRFTAGQYSYTWDASKYSSGIYFYTLTSGIYRQSKSMVLIK